MNQNEFLRLVFLSILCAFTFSAQAMDFRDGVYEISVSQGVKGMPGGVGRFTLRECLTGDKPIPKKYLQGQSCDVLESKTLYHTMHYKLSCFNVHGTFGNEGQLHFSNTQIYGKSKSIMSAVDGISMVVRYKFRGRRIGNCQ